MDPTRTIVALSSGVSAARRAIIRLSGPRTPELLAALLDDSSADEVVSSSAWATKLKFAFPAFDQEQCVPATVYFWPDQRSFTGEPSAELHLIGSLPIVEAVIETLIRLGADNASRGEFTLRSFLAGRIDLAQAEAILGVIEATGESELSFALGQLAGNISRPVATLRGQLIELTAHLEAGLDFVEEDIEFISKSELNDSLTQVQASIEALLQKLSARGSRQRLPSVVLAGAPNAGKSTLFNRILNTKRAIVSAVAGTTRDAIEARVQLGSVQFNLVDTAGLEKAQTNTPRGKAQDVASSRIAEADLVLHCIDQSETTALDSTASEYAYIRRARPASLPESILVVGTKVDLAPPRDVDCGVGQGQEDDLAELLKRIELELANAQTSTQGDALHRTTLRCREGLEEAAESLHSAIQANEADAGEEITATELRLAIESLSAIIGSVHNEDILGEIFGRFCIGK
ncbi:MAG: tRNA modification GTPase [Aureliella sp.]